MRKDFLIFLLLIPVIFYPLSTVVHNITYGPIGFVLFSVLAMFAIYSTIRLKKYEFRNEWFLWLYIVFLIFHTVLGYIALTDLRLIVACILSIFIVRLPSHNIRNIVWYLALFLAVICIVGTIIQLLIYSGTFSLEEWRVAKLNFISETNPALTRDSNPIGGGMKFYLPLYLSNIVEYVGGRVSFLGMDFYRFPFIFAEPVFLSLFNIPVIYAVMLLKEKNKYIRIGIIITLIFMALWNHSYTGLLVLFAVIPFFLISNKLLIFLFSKGKKLSNFALILIALILMLSVYLAVLYAKQWIGGISISKLAEYKATLDKIQGVSGITYFGVSTEDAEFNYGAGGILMGWGIVGVVCTFFIWGTNLMRLFYIYRNVLIISPFIAVTILLLKLPSIYYIYYTLIYAFVISKDHLEREKSLPLSCLNIKKE